MADTLTHDRLAVELAWQSGYDYARQELADYIADLPPVLPPPTRTREERIAAQLAEMKPAYVLGGPLPDWIADHDAITARQDRLRAAQAANYPPLRWKQLWPWLVAEHPRVAERIHRENGGRAPL